MRFKMMWHNVHLSMNEKSNLNDKRDPLNFKSI